MKKLYTAIFLGLITVCQSQNIVFADPDFKALLVSASTTNPIAYAANNQAIVIDTNNDGEISISEAALVFKMSIAYKPEISDISGIGYFNNLKFLYLTQTSVSQLDATGLANLQQMIITGSPIATLNVSGLQNLTDLQCAGGALTSLDVSQTPNLWRLLCHSNQISSLNVSGLQHLAVLGCAANNLATVDLSNLPALTNMILNVNHITSVDVSGLSNLQQLWVQSNSLTLLDVDGLTNLSDLNASNNHLENIFIRDTAHSETNGSFIFNSNPNLQLICTNESKVPFITALATGYGYTGVSVSSTCALGVPDNWLAGFKIYPNPAADRLNFETEAALKSLAIYDVLGQLVKFIASPDVTMDVSDLKSGTYFIHIETIDSTFSSQFIKL
jgi:hypothetical protein